MMATPEQITFRLQQRIQSKDDLEEFTDDWGGGIAKDGTKRYRLEFNHIRDGAYTHATDGGIPWQHAMVLGGHKTGMPDRYIKRNAGDLTRDCCEAIAKVYGFK